jgi:hypothetical protein
MFESTVVKNKVTDLSIANFDKTYEKMLESQKLFGSIVALNDEPLTYLNTGVIGIFTDEYKNAIDVLGMVNRKEDFDEEAILKRISECKSSLDSLLTLMQKRLNELAQSDK